VRVNVRGARASTADFILWMDLRAQNFNADDVVTDRINSVILAGAGHLAVKEGSALGLTPLITSGTDAMGIEADSVRFRLPDPVQLLKDFKSENRAFTLAARFQGPIESAFPDGPPPEETEDEDETADDHSADEAAEKPEDEAARPHRARSDGAVHLVVVADVDILEERFWMQPRNMFGQGISVPIANNADFVINVLDNLAGSDALIGLRSRGLSVRPFHRVDAMQRDAAARFRKTEQELLAKREETEKKLGEFRLDTGRGTIVLTAEQRTTIDNFRKELVSIRRQLRDVQHELRKDVEALMTFIRVVNIWAVPALVSVIAVILAVARRRRYGRGTPAG
ncbi:MAG TPA: ABC transporter, partial [Rhodospirillales bacterium]|nr:ABC transporter [Rhodospirillales bacterium]